MKWERIRLGDIAEFSNGINFNKGAYSAGVKLIGVSNFEKHYYPNYDELSEVKSDIVRPTDFLQDGDIVFVRSNGNKELVGRCMLIKKPPVPITFSGFCIRARLKNTRKHNPTFFTYHFKTKAFRQAMSGAAVGANIQNLSQSRLNSYSALIPDYNSQCRISNILSAYDDLIENNQKQIKLLEEAAQRLYKEWFVDLRFPGHEMVKIVDGVPEGWRKAPVGSLIEKTTRTKQVMTADYLPSGAYPIIDQGKEFIAGYTNDAETLVDLGVPVIVFGDHTRILKYIQFPFAKGADGTQMIVSAKASMPQSLLYCSLKNVDLSNYHYARHFKYLKAEEILVPSLGIASAFCKVIDPIFEIIQEKRDICKSAVESRDRLLPRLMSGELEV